MSGNMLSGLLSSNLPTGSVSPTNIAQCSWAQVKHQIHPAQVQQYFMLLSRKDKNAALKLANAQFPNVTPRMKHLGVRGQLWLAQGC